MNKYIKDDFEKLLKYSEKYSMGSVMHEKNFELYYRNIHKKALAYLILFSEVEKQNFSNNIFSEKALYYLKESVSDVLQSLFSWANGAYKGADLLLRSSIENFNKAVIGNSDNSIFTEKSVYKIFEIAEHMDEYRKKMNTESLYIVMHNIYVELCKSTHTATNANMEHITALVFLPKYEEERAKIFFKMFDLLIDVFLGYFLANYKCILDKMYRVNQDIYYDAVSRDVIRTIING